MRVVLGPLAKSGLEAHVGSHLPAAINAALVFYVAKLNSGQRPPRFPNFAPTQGNQYGDVATRTPRPAAIEPRLEVEVDVDVDEQIEAALRADAEDQALSTEEIAGYAVLVYLAQLDRIDDSEAGPPGPDVAVPSGQVDSPPH